MATRGRPSLYTPEVVEEICRRLADGEPLTRICEDDHLPVESTIRKWALEDREGFFAEYTRARQLQAQHMFDETVDISDVGTGDVGRDRLRVDTRKWWLSKVVPKLYGDRVAHEVSGPDGGPIETKDVTALSEDELRAQAAKIMAKLSGENA